jgi:hypothetical protein
MTTVTISAVGLRRRTTLVGQVISISAFVRPWVRFDAAMGDGTGTITLRFMGRVVVPGMRVGRRIRVEGTPAIVRDVLIIVNPLYEFIPDSCRFN